VYSARSMYRASQKSDSAIRESISLIPEKDPCILAAAAL